MFSGTAQDGGGGVVAAVEVSVDGGRTWHPATGRGSWTFPWVPTVLGPLTIEARAVDDSGNLGPASSVTGPTIVARQCPCSLWAPSVAPQRPDAGSTSAAEVGVKITSDMSGTITGIRFYKSALNTGTHVAHLWTATGTLLASATFTNESSSGWQEVDFAPVTVTAGTVYVASYHTDTGHFAGDWDYFDNWQSYTKGLDIPPLHALWSRDPAGPNGVMIPGASAFPNGPGPSAAGASDENFWVDVVFQPSTGSPPVQRPISGQPSGTTEQRDVLPPFAVVPEP
jgi:hypothetical protein